MHPILSHRFRSSFLFEPLAKADCGLLESMVCPQTISGPQGQYDPIRCQCQEKKIVRSEDVHSTPLSFCNNVALLRTCLTSRRVMPPACVMNILGFADNFGPDYEETLADKLNLVFVVKLKCLE